MTHEEHVRLIRDGVGDGKVWAELGSGTGAFTLALADIAGKDVEIYSIDKNESRLDQQKNTLELLFPGSKIHYLHKDFTQDLALPKLDGILAANAIHFVENKIPFLKQLKTYLKPQGRLLVVEYNVDRGNDWVPYPFSYESFEQLAKDAGFRETKLLHTIYSRFLREIYSAVTYT